MILSLFLCSSFDYPYPPIGEKRKQKKNNQSRKNMEEEKKRKYIDYIYQ